MTISQNIKDYYRGIDFLLWEKSTNYYCDKLRRLKTDKAKKIWALKLYSSYLQLIEVFCINIFAITENRLFENLFISNPKLKQKIRERFFKKDRPNMFCNQFINYFLENWIFGIQQKEKINNLKEKRNLYKTFLQEIIKDYLQDYDLLNAYKHGFRTMSKGGNSISMKREHSDTPPFVVGKYNSSLSYINLNKKEGIVYENSISFNWERCFQKICFLLNMLENTLLILLADGKEIKLNTLCVIDKNEFSKHFGVFRISVPILNIKK